MNKKQSTLIAIASTIALSKALAYDYIEHNVTAIAHVESNNKMSARGKAGERTAWQILPTTWRHYAPADHKMTSRADAYTVALIIYVHNRDRFMLATGVLPNNFDVYAMWNLGFNGYKRRKFNIDKCPLITRRAAMRYHTLCQQLYQEN